MSTTTENKNHYPAIAYTATFLGLLLAVFLFVVFLTSSKSPQGVDKTMQLHATSSVQ